MTKRFKKVFKTDKAVTNIVVDPDLETADVDMTNNSWPNESKPSQFDQFKNKIKN